MSEPKIIVNCNAELFWREPAKNMTETVQRQQANVILQNIAAQFNQPLGGMLELAAFLRKSDE